MYGFSKGRQELGIDGCNQCSCLIVGFAEWTRHLWEQHCEKYGCWLWHGLLLFSGLLLQFLILWSVKADSMGFFCLLGTGCRLLPLHSKLYCHSAEPSVSRHKFRTFGGWWFKLIKDTSECRTFSHSRAYSGYLSDQDRVWYIMRAQGGNFPHSGRNGQTPGDLFGVMIKAVLLSVLSFKCSALVNFFY